MLDAHQLHVFLTAAETLNFTQAAQRLNMSQPSVSQHIQALERRFGTPLFLRAGRTLQLTDAGLTLVPLARELVKQSTLIEETMASLQGEVYGHLLVGCSTTPGKYILPHLLAHFHNEHPEVRITCLVSSQTQAIEALCEGRLHFALTSLGQNICANKTEFIEFLCDPVVLIAPVNHPWAQREYIEIEDMLEANFILREEDSGTYKTVQEALAKTAVPIERLRTLLTLGNSEAIAVAVQEGLGVGFVSQAVASGIGQERVAVIPVKGLDMCRKIYIGRHTRLPATKAQIAFWNFATQLRGTPALLNLPYQRAKST